jgi:hypothetical protein
MDRLQFGPYGYRFLTLGGGPLVFQGWGNIGEILGEIL